MTNLHSCNPDHALLCLLLTSERLNLCMQMYLQQLSETSAASIPPPGVTRTLASKACRHAIMFGDSLTAEQSHQLISGLLKTSLWGICAHGRPTNASLASLDVVQGMISVRRCVAGKGAKAAKADGSRYFRLRSAGPQPHAGAASSKLKWHGQLQQLGKRLRNWNDTAPCD